jgi:hypothetical protein
MEDMKEHRVIGLRLGAHSGAWASMLVRPRDDNPALVIDAGNLDFEVPWLLENLLREADFVAWEKHEMSEGTDKEWAFSCGRMTGRVEALTAGFIARGHCRSVRSKVMVMRGKHEREWTSSRILNKQERDAAVIAWEGWGARLLGKEYQPWLKRVASAA